MPKTQRPETRDQVDLLHPRAKIDVGFFFFFFPLPSLTEKCGNLFMKTALRDLTRRHGARTDEAGGRATPIERRISVSVSRVGALGERGALVLDGADAVQQRGPSGGVENGRTILVSAGMETARSRRLGMD